MIPAAGCVFVIPARTFDGLEVSAGMMTNESWYSAPCSRDAFVRRLAGRWWSSSLASCCAMTTILRDSSLATRARVARAFGDSMARSMRRMSFAWSMRTEVCRSTSMSPKLRDDGELPANSGPLRGEWLEGAEADLAHGWGEDAGLVQPPGEQRVVDGEAVGVHEAVDPVQFIGRRDEAVVVHDRVAVLPQLHLPRRDEGRPDAGGARGDARALVRAEVSEVDGQGVVELGHRPAHREVGVEVVAALIRGQERLKADQPEGEDRFPDVRQDHAVARFGVAGARVERDQRHGGSLDATKARSGGAGLRQFRQGKRSATGTGTGGQEPEEAPGCTNP